MKVIAEPIRAGDLQTGDLFSTYGPEYWDIFPNFVSIGERVFMRTATPAELATDQDSMVYRLRLVHNAQPEGD